MKCIAIDNDAKALEQICAYIEKTPSLQLVAKFDDADNARAYLTSDKNQVDVVFVDTDTNNIGGIDLVKSLIEPPFVVFVSNTTDGAYDALKLGAVDYLRKPFSFDDFNLAIKRVEKAY